jgi:hypothetical protein
MDDDIPRFFKNTSTIGIAFTRNEVTVVFQSASDQPAASLPPAKIQSGQRLI